MKPPNFSARYGPWALVTGASSGIGAEYAKQLAKKELNVALVARRKKPLGRIAEEIEKIHKVQSKIILADLTTKEGIEMVKTGTNDIEIGLLVNNAGREDSGHFLKTPVDQYLNTLALNCEAPLRLTHHYAGKMAARRKGGIIFMSSLVAFQGIPFVANYAATKAYDLILSESLSAEFKRHHIDVVAVAPGFTKTNLTSNFNFDGLPLRPLSPGLVARQGITKLGNRRMTVPGAMNRLLYFTGKYLLPRSINTVIGHGVIF
ncbi:MAG TPA: SDR family NAD(P)-dependent oxidoreductase [Desulfobulbus sp.]|nr:SDR family NAD(P)-dependent oxidoreductase [Desulfobulbus sp.]